MFAFWRQKKTWWRFINVIYLHLALSSRFSSGIRIVWYFHWNGVYIWNLNIVLLVSCVWNKISKINTPQPFMNFLLLGLWPETHTANEFMSYCKQCTLLSQKSSVGIIQYHILPNEWPSIHLRNVLPSEMCSVQGRQGQIADKDGGRQCRLRRWQV